MFSPLTKDQEKLLFYLLDAREKGELGSDSFDLHDTSTYGSQELILVSAGKSLEVADVAVADLQGLAAVGYLTLIEDRQANRLGGDSVKWRGSLRQIGWQYRSWRRSRWWRRILRALAPDWSDVRRVIYSGFFAALLLKLFDGAFWPWARAWWEYFTTR